MGEVNPWLEEAIRRAEARRKNPSPIRAIVEVEPGREDEVVAELRRLGYRVEGAVSNFVFVELPEPADLDRVARLPYVRLVSAQKRLVPLSVGVDELFKRVAVATDPILSDLSPSDLEHLGVVLKPRSELPPPFDSAVLALESLLRESNPTGEPLKLPPLSVVTRVLSPPIPVPARAEWKLVTETRKLMEAPDDNVIRNTYVCVIDTGVYPNPAVGAPLVHWTCDSLTVEPPTDTMGHGSWVHSCAFGQRCPTRYGPFVPVASATRSHHVKVFTALGPATSFQVMRAMEACAMRGCKVVNMSLGGPLQGNIFQDPECALLDRLYRQYGTNFVVAAGNDGKPWTINSPAASLSALCVAAVDWKTMDVASYSSRGFQGRTYAGYTAEYHIHRSMYGHRFDKPDVAGIGGDRNSQIVAAASLWYDGIYDFVPDGFEMMIGTSMATPHVAGLVALAIDRGIVRNVDEVKDRMARHVTEDGIVIKTANLGYGLLTWSKLVGDGYG